MKTTSGLDIGFGCIGLLILLLIMGKVGGIITWPWWWVLCPLWIPIAVTLGVVTLSVVVGLCYKR